jgi:alpha-tubulin suppressor-like RCC1 family protein
VNSDATHTCALDTNDKAYCWGKNLWGQLGNGTDGVGSRSLIPVAVVGPM